VTISRAQWQAEHQVALALARQELNRAINYDFNEHPGQSRVYAGQRCMMVAVALANWRAIASRTWEQHKILQHMIDQKKCLTITAGEKIEKGEPVYISNDGTGYKAPLIEIKTKDVHFKHCTPNMDSNIESEYT
jgi:hypothetical protein